MNAPIIELKGVCIAYNQRTVLERINLSLHSKEITTLLGPSGSGKSTLLKSLCRMNDHIKGFSLEGTVEILEEDIYASGVDVYELRRSVGLVFQKPVMFPRSIYENMVLGVKRTRPEWRSQFSDRVEQSLKEVHLWDEVKDRLQEHATRLSQGQQQRLAIARTLIGEPQILLMDEPTSSLDPKSKEALESLAIELAKKCTLVWVTHDVEQAHRISDRVVYILEGKVFDREKASHTTVSPDIQQISKGRGKRSFFSRQGIEGS